MYYTLSKSIYYNNDPCHQDSNDKELNPSASPFIPNSMLPSSVGEDVNDTDCETCFCPNKAIARNLCLDCLLTTIDELRAAVNLTVMRDSTVNDSEEDDSDEMSNTRRADFGGDLSSIGGNSSLRGDLSSFGVSSSIVDDNVVATLKGRSHNSVTHNPGIQSPLLSPWGGSSSVIQTAGKSGTAMSPIHSNRLFSTNEKEKKKKKKKTTKKKTNKKKNGYVGSMFLRGATANEEKEMITHGELF
jgi:hypothetical protein